MQIHFIKINYFFYQKQLFRIAESAPMTLTLMYVVKVMILYDLQQILIVAHHSLKSY